MELNISGLKCDNCDYRDDSVLFSDFEKSIGRPCPKCGKSLLTQKDFNQCVRSYKIVKVLNIIGNITKWINPFYYIRLIYGYNKTGSYNVYYKNDGTKERSFNVE